MKNKAKRIVSALCALAMFAAMVPAAAFAEEPGTDSTPTTTQTDPSIDPQNFGWCDPKPDTSTVVMSMAVGETQTLDDCDAPRFHSWKYVDSDESVVDFVDNHDGTATVTGLKPGDATIYYTEYKD